MRKGGKPDYVELGLGFDQAIAANKSRLVVSANGTR